MKKRILVITLIISMMFALYTTTAVALSHNEDDLLGSTNILKSIKAKGSGTEIHTGGVIVVLENSTFKGNLKIELNDVSAEYQKRHLGKEAFSLAIISENLLIKDFGGLATVSLPYELKEEEKTEAVAVWRWDDGRYVMEMPSTYNLDTKLATFETNRFSVFLVGLVNPFIDVLKEDWFYDSVCYAYARGLMQGTDNKIFSPQEITSRATIVTILWRMENEPVITSNNYFSDVADDMWYKDAVTWAAENGIVEGYEGNFDPENAITREQLASVLYRYAKHKNYETKARRDFSGFIDKPFVWDIESMEWALASGLIKGDDYGALNPAGSATRSQAATILQRFGENVVKEKVQ